MPWFQADDDSLSHPAMLAVSLTARGLWATAGIWCSKRLTDVVPDPVLASFGSTPELETELRTQGLWKRVRGGYQFQQEGLCKIPAKSTVEYQRELKTARQNRWRESQRRRRVDASTDASTPPSTRASPLDPDPDPSLKADVGIQSADRNGRASPDLIDLIITEVRARTGHHLSDEWAQRTYTTIVGDRAPQNPAAYLRQAIRNEPDPHTRFLPLY